MAILIRKTIPSSSDYYTTGGDITITLSGAYSIIPHFKKQLIKIKKPKTKSRQAASPSDKFDNQVVDLKKGTDEIVIRGWLEDDTTSTAWEKLWQLRAMVSTGGALTNLTIDNIIFSSSTQQAFLEEVTGTINADDSGEINVSAGKDIARIDVALNFFIGDAR